MDRRTHEYAPVVTQYLAVDVGAVDSTKLKGGIRICSLPTCLVQPSLEKSSHVAVLSWRWDFEHDAFQEPSRNIACAIRYAKRKGIRYLFIDIISLDQDLPAQELIPQVALFGTLYETIPVVAAYEDPRLTFSDVVFRPWIYSELKCMLRNPHEIVYVGHGTYQKMSTMEWIGEFFLSTEFKDGLLLYAWASPPATPVLQILNGRNRMADIHDFKFIYPMLADPLIAAEQLDQNDYLLTVALLATASMYGRTQRFLVEPTFTMLSYKKFKILSSLREEHSQGRTFSSHDEAHEIHWKGVKLATLRYHEEVFHPDEMTLYTPRLACDIERQIFTMLGLSQEAYLRFMANEQKRRALMLGDQVHELHVQGRKDLSESYVNVVTMKV
ncbi:Nn.00g100710.m01.CDS01 [Neocucurbitaria sp. VM-36]